MVKEDTTLQQIRLALRKSQKFWPPVLRQAWHDAWTLWLWIFVVPLAVNVVLAILNIIDNGWQGVISGLDSFFYLYVFSFIFVLLLLYFYFSITLSASLFFEQKEKAELFTTAGIEITVFEPSENDIRPAGIFVNNKKKIPIRCSATFFEVKTGNSTKQNIGKPLGWYDDKSAYNFGYAQLEPEIPMLVVLQRLEPVLVPTVVVDIGDGGKITAYTDLIYIEFGDTYGSIATGHSKIIEIQFSFVINDLKLEPSPLKFWLQSDGKKMKVKTYEGWQGTATK